MRRRALLLCCLFLVLALPADAASYSYQTWHTLTLPDPGGNGQVVKDVAATGAESALVTNAGALWRVVGDQAEKLNMPPGIQKLATLRGAAGGEGLVWLVGGGNSLRWTDGEDFGESDLHSITGVKDVAMWWRPAAGEDPAADVAVFAIYRQAFDGSASDSVIGHSIAGGPILEITVPDELGAPQTVAVGRQTGVRYVGTSTGVLTGPDSAAVAGDYTDTGLQANIRTIAVHPTDETIVYAGGPGGFYRRDANGWAAPTTSMAGIRAIAVDAAHPDEVYAANASNIYRSTDQGMSWQSMGLVTDTTVDAMSVGDDGDTLFVGSDGWGLHTFRFDRQAPSAVTMTQPPTSFATSKTVPVGWSATDAETTVASYDIALQTTSPSGATSSSAFRAATRSTSASLTGATGRTYCFQGRARDVAGNVGAYGAVRCSAVPFNNTELEADASWRRDTGAGFYLNSFSRSDDRGATLKRRNVRARRLALVATRCSTCGAVQVLLDGVVTKRIDLSDGPAGKRQFLPITTRTTVWSGTVKIIVTSANKVVKIEGLAASF